MAKIIKITPDHLEEIRMDFEKTLSNAKLSDGKISFNRSFGNIKRDATVFFTHEAWQKMQALIKGFNKEVAWHGLAYRGEDGKDEYYITDILVYPQEVTGATVNTDQGKYQTWLMEHEDDVFNNIRMQGHSHVNMGVTPSGVDNSLYERILEQLDDEMFYIFLIYNKKGDKTFKIYDLAKNILFETGDVTVKVLDDDADSVAINVDGLSDEENEALSEFLAEYRIEKRMGEFTTLAREMVKDRVTTPTRYGVGCGSNYNGNYGGYYGYGVYQNYGRGYQPTSNTQAPTTTQGKNGESTKPSSAQSSGKKRRGSRKGKNKRADNGDLQHPSTLKYCGYDDDSDSPYSPFGYGGEYLRT